MTHFSSELTKRTDIRLKGDEELAVPNQNASSKDTSHDAMMQGKLKKHLGTVDIVRGWKAVYVHILKT